MNIKLINESFSVCQLDSVEGIDLRQPHVFLSVTEDEISYVCPSDKVPENARIVEDGWSALKIMGVLDFSLVGILAKISTLLADSNISIFAISTYNTDYILLKSYKLKRALEVLHHHDYQIVKS